MSHACTSVNASPYPLELDAGRTLLTVLRGELGLTGAKEGCDDSEVRRLPVLVDGRPVNSCSYLALLADGREITTVEGLAKNGELHPLQQAFLDEGGVQCQFCTPGMLISAEALLTRNRIRARRSSARAGWQPVPLYRLPEDRAGGARRRATTLTASPLVAREPIEHMPLEPVARRERGVVEVARRVVGHPDPAHHGP